MSTTPSRIETIKAMLYANPISAHSHFPRIMSEFDEIKNARWVLRTNRRHLLQIIHSSRGVDSTLKTFIQFHQLSTNSNNLGSNLFTLRDHSSLSIGRITESQRSHFQRNIVRIRNRFMHEAGAFPSSENEVRSLISEIQFCISIVVTL